MRIGLPFFGCRERLRTPPRAPNHLTGIPPNACKNQRLPFRMLAIASSVVKSPAPEMSVPLDPAMRRRFALAMAVSTMALVAVFFYGILVPIV